MPEKKRVLIVEDEPDQSQWLAVLLEDNGYSAIIAVDGQRGYEKVKSEKPDLITLDISMPEESGIKFYRKLNEDPEHKHIPVIMITGVAAEFKQFIERRKSVPPPAAYFEKPVEKEALLKKIKELTS